MIPSLLLVSEDKENFLKIGLNETIEDAAQIYISNSGLEGLLKFKETSPMLVIIDSDLPDMRGESVTTIIKDTPEGKKAIVYLINVRSLMLNAQADRLISAPINYEPAVKILVAVRYALLPAMIVVEGVVVQNRI